MAKDEEQNLNEMQDTQDSEQNLETSDTDTFDQTQNQNSEGEPIPEGDLTSQDSTEEEFSEPPQKKAKKLNKILLISIGALIFTLLVLLVLFFVGVFDKEEPQPSLNPELDGTALTQETIVLPLYQFDINDINVTRLNKNLSSLISYVPAQTPPIQVESSQQNQQMKEYEFYDEDIENLFVPKSVDEEEVLITQNDTQSNEELDIIDITHEKDEEVVVEPVVIAQTQEQTPTIIDDTLPIASVDEPILVTEQTPLQTQITTEEKKGNQFLKFIQVATLKYKLYTQFLKEIKAVDARISICQEDRGRIQIFIGPFLEDEKRDFVIKQINKNVVHDAFAIEFTQDEFNKRCGIHEAN
ncbi:hypothetical protein [Arcobacter sp. FWKO B]|uniref:hypothetical protein n=1 Tax=Arcobacter sp. FWKO B TaxID=2593672 RepID=UPI0018A65C74|nr:hypothetical protein [Arcobacter sp. FWKO B]QOG12030.1 hypothetical protein FWKOB_04620 [Arcobacter sp. FWKO B]